MTNLIKANNLPFEFTGKGKVVIGGKVPDFANINGKKQLLELFGDYWHKGQNPQDRIDKFAKFGYQCLVIWEYELKDSKTLVHKISEFERR